MRIDFITEHSKEQLQWMQEYCFGMREDKWFEPGNSLGVFDGDRLAAALNIYPFEMFFCENTIKMGGIGAVTTLPEYRNRQYAAGLLKRSLEIMRERRQSFSMLAPFSYNFYRKYGWELAFHYYEYCLPVEDFRDFGNGEGNFCPVGVEDIPRINRVYEEYARKYNGAIKRSERQWRDNFAYYAGKKYHGYGYVDKHGDLQGYLFFQIKEGKFFLHELVGNSRTVKEELFRFVYQHRAQVREIVWRAPADDIFLLLLKEPRRTCKLVPGMMIRVVDVKAALKHYHFPGCDGSFLLKVDDPWASWNDRLFQVSVDRGRARVREEPAGRRGPDIECSIQTFSQMISGYTGMRENREMGRITGADEKTLDELERFFPARVTYMNDYF